MCLFYEDSFYQETYSSSYSSFKVMLSLRSVCKDLQVIGSTKGSSFTCSFGSHLLHYLQKGYVSFLFQKHPCFFAVLDLVLKDPESVI